MENPYDSQRINIGVKIVRGFIIGIMSLILAFGALTVYTSFQPVYSHGRASWMMQDRYKGYDGMHCCGPNDCKTLEEHKAKVTEFDNGYLVEVPDLGLEHFFEKKDGNAGGLYFTQDHENAYILCIYGGKIKCLAVPRNAGI